MSKSFFNKKSFILAAILIVLTMSYIFWKYVPTNVSESNTSPVGEFSQATDIELDSKNDGVYRDRKYNFTFNYPADIFKYQYIGSSGPSWYNEEYDGVANDPTSYSKTALRLEVIVRTDETNDKIDEKGNTYKGLYSDRFNEIFQVENGTKVDWGATKLASRAFTNYKQVTFYYGTSGNQTTQESTYYSAWFLKDEKPVLELTLVGGSKYELERNKKMFESIIESFEFIQ